VVPIFFDKVFSMNRRDHLSRLVAGVALALSGCARDLKPYVRPVDVVLQDPLPGQALVYLLRSPYDASEVSVFLGERRMAVLPASSYSVITLAPGRHRLLTRHAGLFGGDIAASSLEIDAKPDQRRFFSLSGRQGKALAIAGVLPGGVPLLLNEHSTENGTRSWKECTELDAQGLMSIARLVLPER
jgi:hypothetical protein